jgi:uncharacterized protein (TIGR01777 family)
MKIGVTGSRGLIGSELVRALTKDGHEVIRYNRAQPPSLDGFDVVVHLAGENIAGRWTAKKKERIRESRVNGTRALCEVLTRLARRPKVLVCASATGYYGDRRSELLTEDSAPGTGFLAEVCRAWEAATEPAARAGIRVVNLRFGAVLSAQGGALAKMLPPFRLGLGGVIGNGRQFWSWVALDDAVGAIQHVIRRESLTGPVNVVSPRPVTNREFTKTLGRVLRRPTIFPLPAFAARLVFGEMADAALLASVRVEPARLMATNYRFRFPELAPALTGQARESRAMKRPRSSARAGSVCE